MQLLKKISSIKKIVVLTIENGGEILKAGLTSSQEPHQSFDSLSDVMDHFGKSKPIYLHVHGSGVLSRLVEEKPNYRQELILNGDQNDFIFTSFSDGHNVAVSFVRKSVIDPILDEIEQNNYHLLGFSCGPAFFFSVDGDFKVNFTFSVSRKNGLIQEFLKSGESSLTQEFEGRFVNSFEHIKYCAVKFINEPMEGLESTGAVYCEDRRENYKQFRRLKTVGLSSLILLFIVVIGNRFYQNHLQKRINSLESELSLNNNNIAYLDRLESEKNRKLELVSTAGVTSNNFLGYYLDEIGKSVPKVIKLSSLELFPVDGKLKNKERVNIQSETIFIEGMTESSKELDDWMEELNNFDWIETVELTNYIKNEYEQGFFVLMMKLD